MKELTFEEHFDLPDGSQRGSAFEKTHWSREVMLHQTQAPFPLSLVSLSS